MNVSEIDKLVHNIREHRQNLESTAIPFRTQSKIASFDKSNCDDWCNSVYGDSLIKLRLITDNNFIVIETLSLVSTTRYILELSIWLNLFMQDSRYGLVYYDQLIKGNIQYWERFKNQMEREITFLKKTEKEEKQLLDKEIIALSSITDEKEMLEAASSLSTKVQNTIDSNAARYFSIHAEQAKHNGYGFQASLVERNQLTSITKNISELQQNQLEFNSSIPPQIKSLIPKKWNWFEMAKSVNMEDEYDFIYSFTSKLLHATPMSITTNQKNLESQEIIIFLKYIDVKIRDIIELSNSYLIKSA
ncbi:hypothetical protein E3U32_10170 [Lelliottia nimipressuralis]|uniref:DUF5677 domain-containing protein n=1 Tax=Lelliottia nimipressuralis TaxID=69220 RepID=UPI00106BB2F3|nr:DUF5677 domain-containing protein [Lelliottia nimipressuralis]TFB25516.1 hypothetical protein E3U32_10170 [Lelliottia nimipressuralis]